MPRTHLMLLLIVILLTSFVSGCLTDQRSLTEEEPLKKHSFCYRVFPTPEKTTNNVFGCPQLLATLTGNFSGEHVFRVPNGTNGLLLVVHAPPGVYTADLMLAAANFTGRVNYVGPIANDRRATGEPTSSALGTDLEYLASVCGMRETRFQADLKGDPTGLKATLFAFAMEQFVGEQSNSTWGTCSDSWTAWPVLDESKDSGQDGPQRRRHTEIA